MDSDITGQMVSMSRQKQDRLKIPEEYWDHIGVDKGDDVVIKADEGHLKIASLREFSSL